MNQFAGIRSVLSRSPCLCARKLPNAGIRVWVVCATPWLLHSESDILTGIEVLLVEHESEIVVADLLNHPNKCNVREIVISISAADGPMRPWEPNLFENSLRTSR